MAMRLGRKVGTTAVRGLGVLGAFVWGLMAVPEARGEAPAVGLSLDDLLRMSPAELDALYRQGVASSIPPGRIRGTVLLSPGTWRTRPLARGSRLVWQGKVFEPGSATAVNRFFGLRMIRAQVDEGPSWLDGAPALILDYSQTSRLYAGNRDEIRQIAPGLFLGLMYDRTTAPPGLTMYFALER